MASGDIQCALDQKTVPTTRRIALAEREPVASLPVLATTSCTLPPRVLRFPSVGPCVGSAPARTRFSQCLSWPSTDHFRRSQVPSRRWSCTREARPCS